MSQGKPPRKAEPAAKRRARGVLAWALLSVPLAGAASATDLQDLGSLRQLAERFLHEQVSAADAALTARIEIGPVDDRLRLPRCGRPPAPFLPPGARLHGNGNLGLRCDDAIRPWTLYLTYKISLQGPALVARAPLGARQPLKAGDVELRSIVYERPTGDYLRDATLLEGAMTARPLPAGQPITVDSLLRSQTVRAGQRVKVWLPGAGFVVSQEGTALNAAAPGELVRVRTDAGKILQGRAGTDGRVRIDP
ncbi:MAG: flagellar basal body P-ring formation chaperone FlgA [Thiobacillaceae bacterium]